MATITVLDEWRQAEVAGRIDGDRVVLSGESLEAALGFAVKPEGLCKGDVCITVREGSGIQTGTDEFDAAQLAKLLDRPVVIDANNAAVSVGAGSAARASELQSLVAPDFTLPDLDGRPHSLSDFRGSKVILAAYASW